VLAAAGLEKGKMYARSRLRAARCVESAPSPMKKDPDHNSTDSVDGNLISEIRIGDQCTWGHVDLSKVIQRSTPNQDMDRFKYFHIDKTGKVAIDSGKYDSAGSFKDGLAIVYLENSGRGFIDNVGKEVISPQFEQACNFSEGLAGVQIRDSWGFIDKTGRLVIKPQYEWCCGFSEGMAVVMKSNEVLLIDGTGQTIFSTSMDDLQLSIYEGARFSEGLIDAYDCTKSKTGFIDKSGKFIIEPRFDNAAPFSEGLARVTITGGEEEKLGFIDHSGQFVIPPIFNTDADFRRNSADFSEGLASLTENLRPTVTEMEKFVYIDKKGAIVLFTHFFYAGPFREGLAVVYDDNKNKWGYIDKSGKEVIPLKYDFASDFSEGLACVATQVER